MRERLEERPENNSGLKSAHEKICGGITLGLPGKMDGGGSEKELGYHMKGKSYSTEERMFILGALDAGGDIKSVSQENRIAEQTLRRWRRQMGNQKANETLRREHQKQRNDELEKILADSMLINRVLEAAYRQFTV